VARKRKALKDLDYQRSAYWERLLRMDGLSMEAGTSRRVTYVGDSNTLDMIAGAEEMGTRDDSQDKDWTYEKELPSESRE
jgi:hypothetical protein